MSGDESWSRSAQNPQQIRTRTCAFQNFLEIFAEDNRLNVYAGKLEVRPPAAPTIRPVTVAAESASALPIDLRDVWMTERCAARTLCRTLEFAEISSLLVK
jgi:hypothetical protein